MSEHEVYMMLDENEITNVVDAYFKGQTDAIDEFDRICEEARSHRFGICDADFVIDVIKAKVKEQLKSQN